jgi:hypothetical protein
MFDKRRTGLFDHDVGLPSPNARIDDVRAAMDAGGMGRVVGWEEGSNMSVLEAATYLERVTELVLCGCFE